MKFHFSLVAVFNSFVPLVGGKGPIQSEGYTHYLVQKGGHWKGENKDRSQLIYFHPYYLYNDYKGF